MRHVSDTVPVEPVQKNPTYSEIYPRWKNTKWPTPKAFTQGQPYDVYRFLRQDAPISWTPIKKMRGFWSVARYEDIKSVEVQPDIFSSERGSMHMGGMDVPKQIPQKLYTASLDNLINLDAPRHMELRIQQKDFFIPKFVKTLTEKVGHHIDGLLDNLESECRKTGQADFVKIVTEQVPLFTLCEMLGVDEEDRPKIIRWMHYLEMSQQVAVHPIRVLLTNPRFISKFKRNVLEMFDYGEAVMADRRANPRKDLLSTIANSTLEGEPLTQAYMDGSWLLIIFAGNDTTRNSLSGTMRLLTEFPGEKHKVLEDRSLLPNMLLEGLRMTSPVIHMRRTATQETELAGQKIAENEKLILWYGAANRDPDVFADPDQFDVTRANANKHLAFGHGPHKCLGSRIAQLQLRLTYEKIFDRFPNIKWTGEQKIAPNNFVHGVQKLMVTI